jgi:hypothetical protein
MSVNLLWFEWIMTSEAELKEIRSLLLKLNKKVDGLNELIGEKLIGYEEPRAEDVEAIREHEAAKKNGKLCLVPLSELAKGIGSFT